MENETGRNRYDVIMELVQTEIKAADRTTSPVTPSQIEELFKKYYNLVKTTK